MVVVVGSCRSPGVVVLLMAAAALLLLASTATGVAPAATGTDGGTLCDTAKCGQGTCSEVPSLIPGTAGYKCTCNPGWSQPLNLSVLPDWLNLNWLPCMVPDCTFDSSCYNFSFLWTLPKGIPVLDPCVAINCGSGECKKGTGFTYTCECPPGTSNFLNQTILPCMKNCAFGDDCKKLGLSPPAAPPPQSSTTAPPPGSASSWRLLQQLLWLAILLLQVV